MRQRHYAADAQPSLSIRFDWDESRKRWIMTTTRPRSGERGRADVEYYVINSAAAMDRAAAEILAFKIIAEMDLWLF